MILEDLRILVFILRAAEYQERAKTSNTFIKMMLAAGLGKRTQRLGMDEAEEKQRDGYL